MRLFAVIAALAIVPAAATAQNAYRRTPGDSLRYQEITKVVNTADTPAGPMKTEVDGEGATTFRFRTSDSVNVTLHMSKLTMKSPMGEMSPATGSLQGESFDMLMLARGHLIVLRTPKLPDEVAMLVSMQSPLNDFFVRLPQQPLRVGLVWADTTAHADTTSALRTSFKRIARYKVEKDTVVNGQNAWLITGAGEGSMESAGNMVQGGMDMQIHVVMETRDTDRAIFSSNGFMLSREVRTEQTGTSRMTTPMMPVELAMKGVMEITRRLVR